MYHFLGVVHDQQGYENGLILMPHGTGETTVWKGWSQKKKFCLKKNTSESLEIPLSNIYNRISKNIF